MLGGDPRHGENNGFQVRGTQLTMDGRRFWVNRGLLGREYVGESWRRKPAGGFGRAFLLEWEPLVFSLARDLWIFSHIRNGV